MDKLINFAKKELEFDSSGHDLSHALRVYNNAKKILQHEAGSEKIVLSASLLHDVVDEKLFLNQDEQIKKIELLLSSLNYTEDEISKIKEIILNISYHLNKKLTSKEAMIVQDADRLDAIGSIGIIRTIQYGTSKKRKFYDDKNLKKEFNKISFNEITDSTLSHFYDKLFKLETLMNTDYAKKLAIKRVKIMKEFLDNFYEELGDVDE